jgi:hypothetical protein
MLFLVVLFFADSFLILFIFFIGLPLTVETADSNNAGTVASSAASSVMARGELFVSPPAASDIHLKRKSPPTVEPFPTSYFNCDESSDIMTPRPLGVQNVTMLQRQKYLTK